MVIPLAAQGSGALTPAWRGYTVMYTGYVKTSIDAGAHEGILETFAGLFDEKFALKFHVVSLERCPTSDRVHLQGFARFEQRMRFAQVINGTKTIITDQWERADTINIHFHKVGTTRADLVRCARYCHRPAKPGFIRNLFDRAPEANEAGQGARVDLIGLRDAVRSGRTDSELYRDDAVAVAAIRHGPAVSRMRHAFQMERLRTGTDEGCLIVAFTGGTGLGKSLFISHLLQNLAPDTPYIRLSGDSAGWRRGVGGQPWLSPDQTDLHKVAIIEEWNDNYTATALNAMADSKIGTTFPCKGGHSPWNCRLLLISSNIKVRDWYAGNGEAIVAAVKRRVLEIDVSAASPFYRKDPDGFYPAGWNHGRCRSVFKTICLELASRDSAPYLDPRTLFRKWSEHVWWTAPDADIDVGDDWFAE